ncbi:MAG: alpha/beta hydrolase [Acidobacteria bacterium]|nr:alpha/beta hydrolase [Acidobacteriota bacterium]
MKSILKALFIGEFSFKRLIRAIVLIPICVFLGLLVIAVFFADRAIFRPQNSSYKDTADIIKLKTRNGDEVSARYEMSSQATLTILFSHGNAEDIGMIEPFVWRLRNLGFNVMTYDYPGYGTSGGSPSEEKAYEAIDAAYDYLVTEKEVDPKTIILHGRSLGGGVAVDLASRRPVAGLVLESTFTSAFRVVTRYPILPFDKFENIRKIERVRCPVLIIHGTNDWTIPVYHGRRLFEGAKEPKQALWVEGAGHNDLVNANERLYLDGIKTFVQAIDRK